MATHTEIVTLGEKAERAAVALAGDGIPGAISGHPYPDRPSLEITVRICPICSKPLTGKRVSACSDRCRAALSRVRRAQTQTEKERELRELAEAMLRRLGK